MTKSLHLGNLRIPITEYASQGNAILGIRDSGKSYSATYVAERLLEAGIPFVAFDPIGIWKYLRVAGKGHGYPVVVAGGQHGDLPLTPQSAPEIVRAAMRENLPLVLDLYSIQLSKQDWKRIVEQSVRLLLYENGEHGLRHIFIEEAAEFAPQRVGPDQGTVYAEIEKLARMGGNALLGYTLINQRAEEVNKAVLELCDCLFLHRQKGRNSLTALSKWLDIGDVAESKPIIKSLPTLPQGECWVWPSGSGAPVRVKMPEKNTFHPDRRALGSAAARGKSWNAIDVSAFVQQMTGALEKHLAAAKENDPAELRRRIGQLERELKQALSAQPVPKVERVEVPILSEKDIARLEAGIEDMNRALETTLAQVQSQLRDASTSITEALRQSSARIAKAFVVPANQAPPRQLFAHNPHRHRLDQAPAGKVLDLIRGERAILQAVARCHPMRLTLSQIGRLSGQSLKSSSFKQYVRNVKRAGLLDEDTNGITLSELGMDVIGFTPGAPQTTDEHLEMWRSALIAGERAIFDYVLGVGGSSHVDSISAATGQSLKSSSFKQYLRNLARNGLIEISGSTVRVTLSGWNRS